MSKYKLKPCICGKTPKENPFNELGLVWLECECGIKFQPNWIDNMDELVKAWNNRPSLPSSTPDIKGLIEAFEIEYTGTTRESVRTYGNFKKFIHKRNSEL